tara:strand:- start:297 stop:491 length:195 start_codon:yes stop_codon:yes gene_type:complete
MIQWSIAIIFHSVKMLQPQPGLGNHKQQSMSYTLENGVTKPKGRPQLKNMEIYQSTIKESQRRE